MPLTPLNLPWQQLPAALPIWHTCVDAAAWSQAASAVHDSGTRLVSLWGTLNDRAAAVHVAYALPAGLFWLELPLSEGDPATPRYYPDLARLFPAAGRMQRACADLTGLHAAGASDQRAWFNHGAWPSDYRPLQNPAPPPPAMGAVQDYPFVRVEGDGVHEIAVGPVHAGIIEPGHFRFSIVGEKVLRLEQRLGYVHKGIEQRLTQLDPLQGHRLAGRVSGDSTVAYAWAYCMALESIAKQIVPKRALWLRLMLLERERVANHLGDLGALGNDAAFAFGLAQFSRLREDWQRLSQQLFGHRLLMDCVLPGGVGCDIDADGVALLQRQCDAVAQELQTLRLIYDEHAGLQDRFLTTGRVTPVLAAQLGLTGLAGRASAQAFDLRCDQPWFPYDRLAVRKAVHHNGDVAARVSLRFDEVLESLRLLHEASAQLPDGPIHAELQLPSAAARGAGWVEGWRGELLVTLELAPADAAQRIQRCHCHDPSWQNWPVLEHAIQGNIVPDFPLINKSFNLSYSGHDL